MFRPEHRFRPFRAGAVRPSLNGDEVAQALKTAGGQGRRGGGTGRVGLVRRNNAALVARQDWRHRASPARPGKVTETCSTWNMRSVRPVRPGQRSSTTYHGGGEPPLGDFEQSPRFRDAGCRAATLAGRDPGERHQMTPPVDRPRGGEFLAGGAIEFFRMQ